MMAQGGHGQVGHPGGHLKGDARDRQEVPENDGPGDEQQHHGRGAQGFIEGDDKAGPQDSLRRSMATARTPMAPTPPASVGVNNPRKSPPMTRTKDPHGIAHILEGDNFLPPGEEYPRGGSVLGRFSA